jgi:DNA transformation protein
LAPFEVTMKGVRRAMMSYRKMPDRLYDDPDELAQWAGKALQAAQRKAAQSKATPPKATPSKTTPKSKAVRTKSKSRGR